VLLLDTHVLLWDAFEPRRIARRIRAEIERAESAGTLWCADITLWELAMLLERGRVTAPVPAERLIPDLLDRRGIRVASISAPVAMRSAQLLALGGDPADSLIAATAIVHDGQLVSADARIRAMPGLRVLWS
jgi:PIN domain nuclease of toxin-antitoxin system